jgi:hypothetical protein
MRWAGHVAIDGRDEKYIQNFGKPEVKRTLG